MKNSDLPSNKNPDHALFKVVHLSSPRDALMRVRLEPPKHGEITTEAETIFTFLRVVIQSVEPPSKSEMRAALKYIQPPPILRKDSPNYKAQHALQRLACGELASITAATRKSIPRYVSVRLAEYDGSLGSHSLPFTHSNLLAVFRELLSAGWGFPSPGETDFKGWPRTFVPPSGGWGEDGGSVSDDH